MYTFGAHLSDSNIQLYSSDKKKRSQNLILPQAKLVFYNRNVNKQSIMVIFWYINSCHTGIAMGSIRKRAHHPLFNRHKCSQPRSSTASVILRRPLLSTCWLWGTGWAAEGWKRSVLSLKGLQAPWAFKTSFAWKGPHHLLWAWKFCKS